MTRLRLFRRRLRRFGQVGSRKRALLLEAVFWLAVACIAVLTVPFRYLSRHLGAFTPPADGLAFGRPISPSPADVESAEEIGWAVTRAARHIPFEAVCLPQAMAAQQMLRRREIKSAFYFGVSKGDSGELESHAWLLALGVEVTGYPVAERFTPIACYV